MRGTGTAFRGFATGEAPLVSAVRGRRLAGALAALAFAALALAPAPAGAAASRAERARALTAPLRFATLAWDSDRAAVTRGLAAAGFTRAQDEAEAEAEDAWRGPAYGQRARALPEFDASGRLLALSLRFESARSVEALRRYGELVARVRRQFGPWTFQVAPGRPVREEHLGRYGITRTFGPRTAATLWAATDGAAAAAQLDGDQVLWLRFESPRWGAAHAAPEVREPSH